MKNSAVALLALCVVLVLVTSTEGGGGGKGGRGGKWKCDGMKKPDFTDGDKEMFKSCAEKQKGEGEGTDGDEGEGQGGGKGKGGKGGKKKWGKMGKMGFCIMQQKGIIDKDGKFQMEVWKTENAKNWDSTDASDKVTAAFQKCCDDACMSKTYTSAADGKDLMKCQMKTMRAGCKKKEGGDAEPEAEPDQE